MVGSFIFYFFYESSLVWIPGILCGIFFCRWQTKQFCKKRKYLLEQQFRDWIESVSSALQAGHSVENAFLKAGKEMELLYGEETDIRKETHRLEQLLKNNVTLEKILWDFGQRSDCENIRNFANVFLVGKRSGGNLREMIEGCCEMIAAKIEVEEEIRTLLHGKVMEQKIMCVVPFAIMLYIRISSPGFFDPLYHNLVGICIMTACLCLYFFGVWLSLRIVTIEV